MGDEERAIVHGHTCFMGIVNKVFDFDKEMTKLTVTHEFKLCADIVIPLKANLPSKETALATALNILNCNFGRRHRVFYSDGSSITTPKRNSASPTVEHISIIPSGTAVVYKIKRDKDWNMKHFTLTSRGLDTVFTELAAIAHALTIAMAERALYLDDNKKHSNGKARWSKVTIFSDCTHALGKIRKLLESAIADARLICDPLLRQIMTMLQYFYGNGVQVELRWVPGHSGDPGNCLADTAARYAANHQDIGMLLPEVLNWDT
ncbi:hypothetical protein J3F84DRAFT_355648 [Trichoderma pleuroticola]